MTVQDNAVRAVLIVDDDLAFAESIADILIPRGYHVEIADTPERALAMSRGSDGFVPAVALIDVRLGGVASGVDLIPRLHAGRPDLICVLMTADLDTQTAVAALRRGAYDYFDKSRDASSLFGVLDRCFEKLCLQREREAAYEALRQAKEEAEAANRAKSGFLATMSHELRTPLNAIIGFSEMMQAQAFGPLGSPRYAEYAGAINVSGRHLLSLIGDILDMSRIEAGRYELRPDPIDVEELLGECLLMLKGRADEDGVTLQASSAHGSTRLHADRLAIKQILLNLLSNSVKFTPRGGEVNCASA